MMPRGPRSCCHRVKAEPGVGERGADTATTAGAMAAEAALADVQLGAPLGDGRLPEGGTGKQQQTDKQTVPDHEWTRTSSVPLVCREFFAQLPPDCQSLVRDHP